MALAGNVIWWLTLGFLLGIMWLVFGAIMYLSVIGIPWGRACFELGKLCLAPFGKDVVTVREMNLARAELGGPEQSGGASAVMGTARLIGSLLWLIPGIILAIGHVLHGLVLFITIIGIPLGVQNFKIAGLSLFPVGKRVVSKEMADEIRRAAGRQMLRA